jgi:serine/threonine protein kinase
MWALGIIFYELTAKKRPFHNEKIKLLENSILNDAPPELPHSVPSIFRDIIYALLNKKP